MNRATYGFASLFNRTGQIESNEFAGVFKYDKESSEYLNRFKEFENNVAKSMERALGLESRIIGG